jgi:hypothetical protein
VTIEGLSSKNVLQSTCDWRKGGVRIASSVQSRQEAHCGNSGLSSRDCTLEAMRTQVAPPDLCAGLNQLTE